MLIQPKPYLEKLKLRREPKGTAARRLATYRILENGTPMPKPIEYSDIDMAFFNWVDKQLDIAYDGKRLPTYKLFSSQRISEYSQSWKNLDDAGSLVVNFKTVTRENNPQKGELNDGYYNIPGNHPISIFYVPVLEENGNEAYDKYSIGQPFQINFTYSVGIITNKLELLNEMNECVNNEFKSITCYISPNDHPMPMNLMSISDESEYMIDDRKYYAQTYQIKVKGYIIRKEDITVERIPSRIFFPSGSISTFEENGKVREKKKKVSPVEFMKIDTVKEKPTENQSCELGPVDITEPKYVNSIDMIEEYDFIDEMCKEDEEPRYKYLVVKVNVVFDECTHELAFVCEKTFELTSIEIDNISDFTIKINGEIINPEDGMNFIDGDEVEVSVEKENPYKKAELKLIGFDKENVFDTWKIEETVLDEQESEEVYDVLG